MRSNGNRQPTSRTCINVFDAYHSWGITVALTRPLARRPPRTLQGCRRAGAASGRVTSATVADLPLESCHQQNDSGSRRGEARLPVEGTGHEA